jgi:V/A-type H+-transporting ATPase subunit A
VAEKVIGTVRRIVGPVVEVAGARNAQMLELVEVGSDHLLGEIMRIQGDVATAQVYEDTTGLTPGEEVYGSGLPLSVELGPGIMGSIFDGVQRPLTVIRETSDQYIRRGIQVPVLDREKEWVFTPMVKAGDEVRGGMVLGVVPETSMIEHRVLVPPDVAGTVEWVAPEGLYTVEKTIARVTGDGETHELKLHHRWPVRRRRPYKEKLPVSMPLITGLRVIDMLFPLAKGGSVAVPGGFGTGKTMIQQSLAKWCEADIIIFVGCGERGNEITDLLLEFPKLIDPRSQKSMMERSIIIANTSNMPVAAREASIYTGISLGEYYRDMGYHVAIMADSTSRWAEALRELSGRMEEMPADEGYPAYLPTRLAEFYERAGMVENVNGTVGSVSTVGSISPMGGDFSEPVTQHTRRFVRCFWALDRQLANARHYPAIGWLESYSEYVDEIAPWFEEHVDHDWRANRGKIMDLLQREARLQQVVKLVGPDVLPDTQRLVLDTCQIFKNAFLQQSAFDPVDMYAVVEKQTKMLRIILTYHERGNALIRKGATLVKLKRMKIYPEIIRMKFTVPNDQIERLDDLQRRLERAFDNLEAIYEQPAEL